MYRVSICMTAALLMLHPLTAEIVNKSPEELQKLATNIITGQVTAIYERIETGTHWRTTYYVAEIKISSTAKGEGLQKDHLVYVRYWDRAWISQEQMPPVYVRYWDRAWISQEQMPPSTTGYRGLPKQGDNVRAFLAKNAYDGFSSGNNDGGYNIIGPNGFEIMAREKK